MQTANNDQAQSFGAQSDWMFSDEVEIRFVAYPTRMKLAALKITDQGL